MTRGRPPDAEAAPPARGSRLLTTSSPPGAEVHPRINGGSPLRARLEEEMAATGCTMASLTVLDEDNDPFRLDTPSRHRDGAWLAAAIADLGLTGRPIHLRGLHYACIGRPKPNGTLYANTAKDWDWLAKDVGKAARWLGYVPFEMITDQRNAPPEIREFTPPRPGAYLSTELQIEIPDDVTPVLWTRDFRGVQPYRIVMVGEKHSLADVLGPLAEAYEADLYLPTGDPSDTMLHHMADTGYRDGRPMAVLYFSDCDPSGHQMPVAVARKLQAFEAREFPGLQAEVYRVALTPDQVRQYGLPSTPLKDTERRRGKWLEDMGVRQTEIDALASLQPDLLEEITRAALGQFYDRTLARRVAAYRDEWLEGQGRDQRVRHRAAGRGPRPGPGAAARHAGADRRTQRSAPHRRRPGRPAPDRPAPGRRPRRGSLGTPLRFGMGLRLPVPGAHRLEELPERRRRCRLMTRGTGPSTRRSRTSCGGCTGTTGTSPALRSRPRSGSIRLAGGGSAPASSARTAGTSGTAAVRRHDRQH